MQLVPPRMYFRNINQRRTHCLAITRDTGHEDATSPTNGGGPAAAQSAPKTRWSGSRCAPTHSHWAGGDRRPSSAVRRAPPTAKAPAWAGRSLWLARFGAPTFFLRRTSPPPL